MLWPCVLLLLLLSAPALFAAELPRRRAVEHQSRVADVKRVFVVILEEHRCNHRRDPAVHQPARRSRRVPAKRSLHRASVAAELHRHRCRQHARRHRQRSAHHRLVSPRRPRRAEGAELEDLRGELSRQLLPRHDVRAVAEGQYVRRHVPFLSFVNVQHDFTRCVTHVVSARSSIRPGRRSAAEPRLLHPGQRAQRPRLQRLRRGYVAGVAFRPAAGRSALHERDAVHRRVRRKRLGH